MNEESITYEEAQARVKKEVTLKQAISAHQEKIELELDYEDRVLGRMIVSVIGTASGRTIQRSTWINEE